jgi:hypothetical protein
MTIPNNPVDQPLLKLQTALTGSISQRLDSTNVSIATTVKHNLANSFIPCTLSQ